MAIELPKLPYADDALEPVISAKTISYHYGKHHATYVKNLNGLIEGTENENKSLEEIIESAPKGGLFNNAAQVWNHTFYWNSMKPKGGGTPSGELAKAIEASFGSVDECIAKLTDVATKHFGSGWAWLVSDGGKLAVTETSDADLPMKHGQTALLTVDVWEHAYYLDHQNVRADYVKGFFDKLVNWDFAAENLKSAK